MAEDDEKNDAPLLSQFQAFTGSTDPNVARQYLEISGNQLETAVGLFVEMNEGPGSNGADDVREEEREEGHRVATSEDDDAGDNANNIIDDIENLSLDLSEPDYDDYLLADENDAQTDVGSEVPSTPDYDHLGLDFEEHEAPTYQYIDGASEGVGIEQERNEDSGDVPRTATACSNELNPTETEETDEGCIYYADVEDIGEDYILGTLMVRVLQAKNLKSNPHTEGGGIGGLLSKHRRFRHHRSTMSPISGGNLTPSSYYKSPEQQLYAKLSFKDQNQFTSMAAEHSHGDYHWSRGDQSYFDVTCPSFPLKMGGRMQQPKTKQSASAEATFPKKDASCAKSNSNVNQTKSNNKRPLPPILQLSLYSKKPGSSQKQSIWSPSMQKNDDSNKNNDTLLGKCSINVLQILSGKTPYFDEWCTLHNDNTQKNNSADETAGRIRIVIEYESTDPPPRPGDMCAFANAYPLAEELYPIPLHSIRNTVRPSRSSMSMSTLSSASSAYSSSYNNIPSLTCRPKTYRVEEVVGDHVVLSYQTPDEGWQCTFEVHRYLLLCVERHQAVVEKYREHVLDLCDNLSQSPAVHTIAKTVETLPDEGLVYVGAEVAGGGVSLLGRWWEIGMEGMVEDVVDGINLDGRYSHLSDDEDNDCGDKGTDVHNYQQGQLPTTQSSTEASQDERKAIPGMPCCPITGLPMVEPVVAADGHTYERPAIARWLQTSNRSPLTGEVLAHAELVPNYLLLSSFGNEVQGDDDGGEDVVDL